MSEENLVLLKLKLLEEFSNQKEDKKELKEEKHDAEHE